MSGLLVFPTLRAALNAGYQVYDEHGYGFERKMRGEMLVRTKTERGWALAIVDLSTHKNVAD